MTQLRERWMTIGPDQREAFSINVAWAAAMVMAWATVIGAFADAAILWHQQGVWSIVAIISQ
ncbi:hypothetical protein [Sodalis sp.]|uniref:hypothetical protein n=1 Tax=Sodalis sp. (in: enterobacteria) TaxID=1898979 RepID=UPI003872F039